MNTELLERALDSFSSPERQSALQQLAAAGLPAMPVGGNVNMHCHSFFSYNALGYSPSHVAWAARREGLYAAALCDFDVLDGQEEFLEAGLLLGLRAAVHVETRVFLREFAAAEITSPGEPGITYIMGAGFARPLAPGSPPAVTLARYREQAGRRNRALVDRVNARVPTIAIEYDRDVVPLSPGGCPTERHIIRAYVDQAAARHAGRPALAAFWSPLLRRPAAEVEKLLDSRPALEERVRAALAKKGGLGYEQPGPDTFPPAQDFIDWVLQCDAIPMMTWLDGTSKGEEKPEAMLECLRAKGVEAMNIIPDRNWNYADPAARALKTSKLRDAVAAAERMHVPLNIGTELNKDGLPFVDDLEGPALRPYRDVFRRGAEVFVGHTLLARYAGFSFVSAAARSEFGTDRQARNRFFASVGALPPLSRDRADSLCQIGPDRALDLIRDAARRGQWSGSAA